MKSTIYPDTSLICTGIIVFVDVLKVRNCKTSIINTRQNSTHTHIPTYGHMHVHTHTHTHVTCTKHNAHILVGVTGQYLAG